MKVGWLAVFDVFSAHCAFSRFSRSKPPTNQPTNLQHQTACSARDMKVGRAANLRTNRQPSGHDANHRHPPEPCSLIGAEGLAGPLPLPALTPADTHAGLVAPCRPRPGAGAGPPQPGANPHQPRCTPSPRACATAARPLAGSAPAAHWPAIGLSHHPPRAGRCSSAADAPAAAQA